MTTATAVKAALLEALQDNDQLEGVRVEWGRRLELPTASEYVYILTDVNHVRTATRGTVVVRGYDINLAVGVIANQTIDVMEERMREIEGEVEATVDVGLGWGGDYSLTFHTGDQDEVGAYEDALISQCRPHVSVRAL